jgi:hypothetical protein
MFKKVLYLVLLLPLLHSACKKGDSGPANEFVINGVRDVNFTLSTTDYLLLSVKHTSGSQERVTISVTGLPTGVNAVIDPSSGTPDFESNIIFSMAGNAISGTYPIKIIGTAASSIKTYDLNLVVPPFNGFIIDGQHYRGSYWQRSLNYVVINSDDNDRASMYCYTMNPFPTMDGTYTYNLDSVSDPNNMGVECGFASSSDYYTLNYASGKTATVKITGGKMSLNFPAVTVYDVNGTGLHRQLSASATEQ